MKIKKVALINTSKCPSSWTNFWKVHLKLSILLILNLDKLWGILVWCFLMRDGSSGVEPKYFNQNFFLVVTSPFVCTPLPPLSLFVTNSANPPPPSPRWRHFWMAPYVRENRNTILILPINPAERTNLHTIRHVCLHSPNDGLVFMPLIHAITS